VQPAFSAAYPSLTRQPPAGLTEEQITEIFSAAGRVINFRLVYDRETGRPKGFGFAEFPDYGSSQHTLPTCSSSI
jgi:RNA recognition motif-containing protein